MFENIVLNLPIIGTKTIIRNFNIDDYYGIRTWVNNKTVTQGLMDSYIFDHFHSEKETNDFLNSSLILDYTNIRLVVADKITNEYLGQIALFNFSIPENNCEIDIVLANPENWNKGIGSETIKLICKTAFFIFNLDKIYAKIKMTNKRAFKCATNSGFIISNNDFPEYIILSLMNCDK